MEAAVTLDTICAPSDDVVAREIEGDVIIVPLTSGIGEADDELYTLNETGRAIWQQLDGQRTLGEVAAALGGQFEAAQPNRGRVARLRRRAGAARDPHHSRLTPVTRAAPRAEREPGRASLSIGRVLADRDGVTFRAQGTCMYPTLRPGDVLRVRSCSARDVSVGDIAVCRTPEYLFSHRVSRPANGTGALTSSPGRTGPAAAPIRRRSTRTCSAWWRASSGAGAACRSGPRPSPIARRVAAPPRRTGRARAAATGPHALRRQLRGHAAGHARLRLRGAALVRAPADAGALRRARARVREPRGRVSRESSRPTRSTRRPRGMDAPVERWTLAALVGEGRRPAAWATFEQAAGRRLAPGGFGGARALSWDGLGRCPAAPGGGDHREGGAVPERRRDPGARPVEAARGEEGAALLRPRAHGALQQRLPALLHQPAGRRPGGARPPS